MYARAAALLFLLAFELPTAFAISGPMLHLPACSSARRAPPLLLSAETQGKPNTTPDSPAVDPAAEPALPAADAASDAASAKKFSSSASDGDWFGLPGAIKASQYSKINTEFVEADSAEALLRIFDQNRKTLNSVNVATALHHLAKLLKRSRAQRDRVLLDPRFLALIDAVILRAPECNPRSVSDVLWACATMQHWPPTMLKPVLMQMAAHLESGAFEAQHVSLIVWSLASLGCKPTVLLAKLEETAVKRLGYFNMQNRANVLWGFAKLNFKPEQLLPELCDEIRRPEVLLMAKPVEIADISFALASLGYADAPLLLSLAGRAAPQTMLDKFSSRQLVTLLWSFAKTGVELPAELVEAWVARVREQHSVQPLLAQDKLNCERSLEKLGQDTSWLHPPPAEAEEAEEASEPSELERIRERIAAEKAAKGK